MTSSEEEPLALSSTRPGTIVRASARNAALRRTRNRGGFPSHDPPEPFLSLALDEQMARHWNDPVTRRFWHLRNSYLLRTETGGTLHSELLLAILRWAPQVLTPHILATYFVVGLDQVDLSISIDAIAHNPRNLPALLLSLVLARGSAVLNRALASASVGEWGLAE